ncbi:MAG: SBBP repeat-containing protein [Acidobacteriia bacterium]|nr:SBBP repeat-containing protein [Terriglobia bacterium]
MKQSAIRKQGVGFLLFALLLSCSSHVFGQTPVSGGYGKLPMAFESNQGQSDIPVRFLARGQGYGFFLTRNEAVLSLHAPSQQRQSVVGHVSNNMPGLTAEPIRPPAVVRMRLMHSNQNPQLAGLDPQTARTNYFIGNDPAQWRHDVPSYRKVMYSRVYPGIDLIYYGNQQQLEYDFVVSPGADPKHIELTFKGAKKLALDQEGNLLLATAYGNIMLHKPLIYQEHSGERQVIDGGFILDDRNHVKFQVASYDTSRRLIIDPVLVYSTYLGGSSTDAGYDIGTGNSGNGIAVDADGNAYVVGQTMSTNFPTTAGVPQAANGGSVDVFVAKLNPTGTALVYSTYLGGSGDDYGRAIAVDSNRNAYVTGWTSSSNFPTTGGALQPTFGGGSIPYDAFVTKLNAAGSALVYSTYLGGSGDDYGTGIAVDSDNNAFVTGFTTSSNFSTTVGAYQASKAGGYYDSFVAKLNPGGNGLLYSTYLGGSDDDFSDAIAEAFGYAFVTGRTYSNNYPTSVGAYQSSNGGGSNCFVTALSGDGSALEYSTYLGGNNYGGCDAIALSSLELIGISKDKRSNPPKTFCGGQCFINAFVTGETSATNFPTTAHAFQPTLRGGADAFVSAFDSDGALTYSSYLGGFNNDYGTGIALGRINGDLTVFVTGYTYGSTFPTTGSITGAIIYGGFPNGFVTALNSNDFTNLTPVYSSYFGGGAWDFAYGIAADSSGNAYITGITWSSDFPTSEGAFQTSKAGYSNAFVTKISPTSAVATTTGVVSAVNPSWFGQSVTFTATVSTGSASKTRVGDRAAKSSSSPSGAAASPTGTIQFKDGSDDLGSPVTMTDGSASYTTSALALGSHAITAVYSGDAGNDPSTSPILTQVVVERADLQITETASSASELVGTNEVYSVAVTNLGPNTATGVSWSDAIPSGATMGSFTNPLGWACGLSGGLFTCTKAASMAMGETDSFTIALTVNCGQADGTVVGNTDTVTFPGFDPVSTNNSSSTAVTVSNPSSSISPRAAVFRSRGGLGTIQVSPSSACPWLANSNAAFLTIVSYPGTGNGAVSYSVAQNPGSSTRSGTLTIGGQTFTVTQTTVTTDNSQAGCDVPANGDCSYPTPGAAQVLEAGYATVQGATSKKPGLDVNLNQVYGTAVFSFTQHNAIVSEAGVPAPLPTTSARIFVDYRPNAAAKTNHPAAGVISVDTGMAVVNPGTANANLRFTLRDGTGATLSSGRAALAAGNHRALYIDQLNQWAPDFILPANFGTAIQFGTLTITSDQAVSVVALRMTVNQRGETLLTTTPVADTTSASSNASLYLPQVADGGGFTTTIILLNTTSSVETGTLRLFNNDGSPLLVHRVGDPPGTASQFTYSIPADGVYFFQSDGSPGTIYTGSAQVAPNAGMMTPAGAGLFHFAPLGTLVGSQTVVTESGVPSAIPTTHALIYVDQSHNHMTGLALAAPTSTPVHVTFRALMPDGVTPVGTGSLDLPGNGHNAHFAQEFISNLPAGFTGVLEITAPTPVAMLSLRALVNVRGEMLLATFPVADFNRTTPVSLLIPQIADGGGYQTQMVLLNTSPVFQYCDLFFLGDDGLPLDVAK